MTEEKLQRVPSFQLMVSDQQYRAIGHVALQWAFLESEIDREIVWLNEGDDEPVKLGAKFEDRAKGWRRMAALAYEDHPTLVETVEDIGRKAVQIKGERDALIHCNLSSSGVVFRIRKARIVEVSDAGTAAHIEDLACRISDITAALFKHQTQLERLLDAPF